jgi:Na+/glutamate symporter
MKQLSDDAQSLIMAAPFGIAAGLIIWLIVSLWIIHTQQDHHRAGQQNNHKTHISSNSNAKRTANLTPSSERVTKQK